MKKYILCPILIKGKEFKVSHEFTDKEVEDMMKMPRIGVGISFKKAYAMRYNENSDGKKLLNTKLIRKKLDLYLKERGLYLDFEEDELHFTTNSVFH